MLINISDHYTRTKANSPESEQASVRVLGCLMGQQTGRVVDISNSFEIKYKVGPSGVDIDEGFLVHKQEQCERLPVEFDQRAVSGVASVTVVRHKVRTLTADKQTFASLDVVGWYGTGAQATDADMIIHRKVRDSARRWHGHHDCD